MIPNENFSCHQKLIIFIQNKNNGIGQKSEYFVKTFNIFKNILKLCKILILIE